ncbi:hypothetical protein [Pseudonocardia sp. GCM10023141]|uniref:hypothetical protein n=1 Tax=Pseudonocardia sp. GCM10023141 TaxID=3252653 RepID=UPI00361C623D
MDLISDLVEDINVDTADQREQGSTVCDDAACGTEEFHGRGDRGDPVGSQLLA